MHHRSWVVPTIRRIPLCLSILCLAALYPGLLGHGHLGAQTIEELEERIAALEAERTAPETESQRKHYLTKLGSMFKLYGFLRLDAVYDDSEFNDNQVTFRVLPESSGNRDDDDFSMYPRLTRLGLAFKGPDVAKAALSGRLEVDFYAFDTSDSRDQIRLRHAYLKVDYEALGLLVGQTSDLISPLYPSINPDLINWNAGNLGDRRPQVRGTYAPQLGDTTLSIAGALAMQGSIDGKNTDAPDGVLDGEDSGVPQLQSRIGLTTPLFGKGKLDVGVWGFRGWEEVDGDGVGDFDMHGYGIDIKIPIFDRFSIMGEVWQGQNLSDVRGGVAQGINATTLEEIDARGGWIQGTYSIDQFGDIFAGYTVDDPDSDDVSATGGVTNNSAIYVGLTIRRWDPLVMGFDWQSWDTRYRGANSGDANRFRWYMSYKF